MKHLIYLTDRIILSIFKKKHGEETDSPSIRIYVTKIVNRVKLKIKTGYYLKLLTPETMKLLGSTYKKANKNKNGEMFLIFIIP